MSKQELLEVLIPKGKGNFFNLTEGNLSVKLETSQALLESNCFKPPIVPCRNINFNKYLVIQV